MLKIKKNECLLIIDFGSQVTQLIARRLRELSVYCEIHPFQSVDIKLLKKISPKAIVFSGGPSSVLSKNSPKISKKIYTLNVPILGICYGQQIMMLDLGGEIKSIENTSEFGRAFIEPKNKSALFDGWFKSGAEQVWMSHGDHVSKMASGFKVLAVSKSAPFAGVGDIKRNFYGVQFHPEVYHTPKGKDLFENFLKISGFKRNWTMNSFYQESILKIRKKVGNHKVICALSGGVDSSVTAVLLHKAIGKNLKCIFVNHGLLRKNEHYEVLKMFKESSFVLKPPELIGARKQEVNVSNTVVSPQLQGEQDLSVSNKCPEMPSENYETDALTYKETNRNNGLCFVIDNQHNCDKLDKANKYFQQFF